MKKYNLALHVFRRDLRLEDNSSLNYALKHSKEVALCFIFDPRQLENNPYRSDNALNFMINSLRELYEEIGKRKGKLYFFYGKHEDVIENLISKMDFDLVSFNKDYTKYAMKRDGKVKEICAKHGVEFKAHADALINEPEDILKKDKTPYTVFSFYYKKAKQIPVRSPEKISHSNYFISEIENDVGIDFLNKIKVTVSPKLRLKGGRKEGLLLLEQLKEIGSYSDLRDYPSKDYTSHLSAHHEFGTISIRETIFKSFTVFSPESSFISELYWRDFFTQIAYFFPHVFSGSFKKKYDNLEWENDSKLFSAWKNGKTGYPIVDAGMRELNQTGYMHNRVRMIVSSFLIKDLHVDWREGEKYFATKLLDNDPAVNNGNWQWAASTGCDAQPYFRIFNPFRQQKRFDEYCEYIKKWVPELKDLSSKEIHKIEKNNLDYIDYPKKIVNHKEESDFTKSVYSYVSKKYKKD